MKNIILYGMRGAGKTTIGKSLSNKLGYQFYDLDKVIEENTGIPAFDFVQNNGWDKFREIENLCLKDTLEKKGNKIISLGGGTILEEKNRDLLLAKYCKSIYIYCSLDEIYKRIKNDQLNGKKRNSLSNLGLLEELELIFNKRKDMYEEFSDIRIENNLDIDNVLENIINKLE